MILDDICATKKEEVLQRKQAMPQKELEEVAARIRPARDFRANLRLEGISLIAEIKRRSPSKGMLMENLDAVELASVYEASGARAISVLTDEPYFRGTLEDLVTVHQTVALPCLRKDFIIDEYQIFEARAHSADAILLIVQIVMQLRVRQYPDNEENGVGA